VLNDGDAIRLGEVVVTFRAGDPEPAASPAPAPAAPPAAAPAPAAPPAAAPVSSAAAAEEAARLRSEVASRQAQLARAPAARPVAAGQIRHLQGLLEDARRRVQDAESRASVAASALDGVHTKYASLREQVQHLQERLEAVRAEADDRESEAADLRAREADLSGRLEALQARGAGAADEVAGLKIKLTEKERDLERLRREIDVQAYDLKALREENARLEEYCQTDTGRQQMLERKVRNLEAVIEENRNLIEELRRTVEEREVEIRRVRAGAGMTDLEEDRRRLLDDFHKRSRELDEARALLAARTADLGTMQGERDEAMARIRQLEEAARTRRSEREDVSDHPEYLARVREVEALEARLSESVTQAEQARAREEELRAEAARLTAELAQAQRHSATIQARVEDLAPKTPAPQATPPVVASVASSLLEDMAVMQVELRGIQAALAALSGADLPPAVVDALGGATPAEAADGVGELLRILSDDTARLQAALAGGEAGR
jgi:chromosome segregation ATPase